MAEANRSIQQSPTIRITALASRPRCRFKVHPHMLRHATSYVLANKGIDTRTLQSLDVNHRTTVAMLCQPKDSRSKISRSLVLPEDIDIHGKNRLVGINQSMEGCFVIVWGGKTHLGSR